jgi:hypothetical protein
VGCALNKIKKFKMKILKYFIALFSVYALAGCTKTEDVNNTETKVGQSRVTFFPTFEMKGPRYSSIVKGGSFTDPGVTAKEGADDLQIQTTGTVDAATPGVYDITYSATNKDGFSASVTRTVAILPEAEQAGVDISGGYVYATNAAYTAVIEKLAPGFYLSNNVWGPNLIPSYIFTSDGATLTLPLKALSGYGDVQGTGTLDGAGNLTLKVDLLAYGIAGSTRKWKKQ